jgi:hypothetical protein
MTTVASAVTLVDPTVETVGVTNQMAPRPRTLDGLTIGLLNNSKGKADEILDCAYKMLGTRYKLGGAIHHVKGSSAKPAGAEAIDDMVKRCQIAITAIGD